MGVMLRRLGLKSTKNMISAPKTPDEKERLKDLFGYEILDTDAEKVFDDLTQLASEICDTPIALISLVDPNRQWFKSKVGIDAQETDRDIAFCAHAIHQREIFEVSDASKDERFFDNPLVASDPNIRFYAGAPLITPAGRAIGTLCTISDKPKQLNKHQRKALEILGREVIAQMELRRSLKIAVDANEYKTEFLSNISHEIRTPLNAITGFSQILLEQSESFSIPNVALDYIKEIEFSSQRLLHVVNSVLDLSKIESGKMTLSPQWLYTKRFIEHLHSMMQIKAKNKGVELLLSLQEEFPEQLFIDEGKLGQILINIINNSIKFTDAKKKITLKVFADKKHVVFTIKDEGIGISELDQQKLFNKYQQVGLNMNKEGTGLGLCISKSIVELMSGEIELISKLGKGTTVKIALPYDSQLEPPNPEKSQSHSKNQTIASHRILIVDDHPINRKLAKVIFGHLKQQMTFAESGEEAVKLTKNNEFDAIFMDIHMPGISGVEASRQIRTFNKDVPIFALTADVFQSQKRGQHDFIFDEYLTKPIDKEKLKSLLLALKP